MDKYIFDESNGLWYELRGDYYFPCLTLSVEEEQSIAFIYKTVAIIHSILYHI